MKSENNRMGKVAAIKAAELFAGPSALEALLRHSETYRAKIPTSAPTGVKLANAKDANMAKFLSQMV